MGGRSGSPDSLTQWALLIDKIGREDSRQMEQVMVPPPVEAPPQLPNVCYVAVRIDYASTINELLNQLAAHDLARAAGAQSTLTGLGALNNLSRILREQLKASFSATVIPRRTDSLSPSPSARPPSAAASTAGSLPAYTRPPSLTPGPRKASAPAVLSRPVSLVENLEMAARLAQAELDMKAMLGRVEDEGKVASVRTVQNEIMRTGSVRLRPETPSIRLSSHDGDANPVRDPRPVSDFQRNVIDILDSLNSTNLISVPDVVAFWVNSSVPEQIGPTLHDLTVAIADKATGTPGFPWLYAEFCAKLMVRISLPLNRRNSAKLDGGMETGGDLARGGALFRQYLADRCTDLANSTAGTVQLAVFKFAEELLARDALTEGWLHRAIERLLPRAPTFRDDEAKSLYRLLSIFGRSMKTPKARHQMEDYCQQLDATRDNEEISAHVCTLLLSTKGFLRRGGA